MAFWSVCHDWSIIPVAVRGQCIYPELWDCLQDCGPGKARGRRSWGDVLIVSDRSKACEVNCEAAILLEKQYDLLEATTLEAPEKVEGVTEEGESVRGGAQAPPRQDAWG